MARRVERVALGGAVWRWRGRYRVRQQRGSLLAQGIRGFGVFVLQICR